MARVWLISSGEWAKEGQASEQRLNHLVQTDTRATTAQVADNFKRVMGAMCHNTQWPTFISRLVRVPML